LKNKYGDKLIVVAVYASPKTRYHRLSKRKIRPLTHEEAQTRDISQIENLHTGGPIAMADFTIINESSIEEFKLNINHFIEKHKL